MDVVYLDFQKAFDKVPHQRLLLKLKAHGLHIDETFIGLLISQWLPCPLAIWNLLVGMAILLNLVKYRLML